MKKLLIFVLLLSCFCTGCIIDISTEEKEKKEKEPEQISPTAIVPTIMKEEESELTLDYLEGTWLDECGFVCYFKDGQYRDYEVYGSRPIKLTKEGHLISGDDIDNLDIPIEVIDPSSMKMDDVVVYRSDSEQGKKFMEDIKKKIIGAYEYEMNYQMRTVNVTDSKIQLISINDAKDGMVYEWKEGSSEEEQSQEYQFAGDKMIISDGEEKEEKYIRLDSSKLHFIDDLNTSIIYRLFEIDETGE